MQRKTVEEYEALCQKLAADRDAKSEIANRLALQVVTLTRELLHGQRAIMAELGLGIDAPAPEPLGEAPGSLFGQIDLAVRGALRDVLGEQPPAEAVDWSGLIGLVKKEMRNVADAKRRSRRARRKPAKKTKPKKRVHRR